MEKRAHGFVAGLLGGGALGDVVVLLFTPLSGREAQRLLPEKGQSLRDEVGEVTLAMRWILEACLEGR
jgi:gas vesicle protein